MTPVTPKGQRITGHGNGPGERLLASLPYVSLLGVSGIAVNLMLSFEEPQAAILLVSALLLAAAPAGMLLHLATTAGLAPREKRMWMSALAGGGAPRLFAAYFDAAKRRAMTRTLAGCERRRHR